MTQARSRTEFKLTLRPEPDKSDPAGIRRLRRALKCLLRSFGLRCVDIQESGNESSQQEGSQ
jgi:hypothetical protein